MEKMVNRKKKRGKCKVTERCDLRIMMKKNGGFENGAIGGEEETRTRAAVLPLLSLLLAI